MSNPQVALCGPGTMGWGMAQNLLDAGDPLAVYNRSREKAERLAKDGAEVSNSPREVAINHASYNPFSSKTVRRDEDP